MRAIAATLLTLFLATGAYSQQIPGDPVAGLELARTQCVECHYVEREWADLSVNLAPDFIDIAGNAQYTPMSLRVFFRTPHTNMPNIILSDQQIDDVIAYILSLKSVSD